MKPNHDDDLTTQSRDAELGHTEPAEPTSGERGADLLFDEQPDHPILLDK